MASGYALRQVDNVEMIDRGIKNTFRWDWLLEKVDDTPLGDFIRKLKVPGKVKCIWCDQEVCYGGRGCAALKQHAESVKHKKITVLRKSNYALSFVGSKLVKDTCPSTVPYGVPEMFKDVERKKETPKPAVPIDQRVCHQEAMLLGFVAENSLSFSIVPKIVDLTKELARDKSALERLSIDRTTASYKMRHGLAASVNSNLNNVLQNCHFSLNVDESTSNNYFKVLEILVSYFSEEQSAVVVQHLDAISLIKVNAESIHTAIVDQFEKREIPWNNLVSILMDSCNVMRGTKSGVETRIREQNAPHLLNVDGDSCHHVNNIAKKFCCALKTGIPKLFTDLHNDFKWSADMRDFLQELCLILRVKYTMPAEHVSHRWLSIYGIAVDTLRMMDVFTVFYHGFLSKEDKLDYTAIVVEIHRKHLLNDVVKGRIREIHRELEKKLSSCTQDGKDRKHRIIEKLFYHRRQSLIVLNIIESIYPMFKRYVMLFQKKDPMIHLLHEEQVKLVKDLYSCFLKPEKFTSLADTDLLSDDINIRASTLSAKDVFIGANAKVLIRDAPKKEVAECIELRNRVLEAYIISAEHMRKTLPLKNKLLQSLAMLDPRGHGHHQSLKLMKRWPTYAHQVLSGEESTGYERQIHYLHSDMQVPLYYDDERVDKWWARLEKTGRYSSLCKMAKSLLTIFHGPTVESSFNIMSDVMDKRSARMAVGTYSAIQSVKYDLSSKNQSAVNHYHRDDIMFTPVSPVLVNGMNSAYRKYKAEQEEGNKYKSEMKDKLNISCASEHFPSKTEVYKASGEKAIEDRLAHRKKYLIKRKLTSKESDSKKK